MSHAALQEFLVIQGSYARLSDKGIIRSVDLHLEIQRILVYLNKKMLFLPLFVFHEDGFCCGILAPDYGFLKEARASFF